MTVWWKHRYLLSTAQLRQTGLIDHLLYPQYRPFRTGQLTLWIGSP